MLPTLLAIAALHWIVLLMPGANFLLISGLAAGGARGAAAWAAVGIAMVTLFWASLAVLGVHTVFDAHPTLRFALQVAGGLYLLWVAVRLWRSGAVPTSGESISPQLARSHAAAFRLGALTNALNPKPALFFGSVFASALPADPVAGLLGAVVAMVFINSLVWHLLLAVALSTPTVRRAYAGKQRALNRVAGTLVGLIGLRLLWATAGDARLH